MNAPMIHDAPFVSRAPQPDIERYVNGRMIVA